MADKYILDPAGNPQPEPDLLKWAEWMETGERVVKQDYLPGEIKVSTVFLGLDHNHQRQVLGPEHGDPILWETMIFGGPHDQYMDRYSSRKAAEFGHSLALSLAKGEITEEEMPALWGEAEL